MASDHSSDPVDLDSWQTCLLCSNRMSSLLHDKHTVCVVCRGSECSSGSRCNECSAWEAELMVKYVKHMKSLASKSKSKAKSKKSVDVMPSSMRSRSSSEDSSAAPSGSGDSFSANPLTEDRVAQLIASQMSKLSESFATSMEVSFANIQSMIDNRLASHANMSNHSFSGTTGSLHAVRPYRMWSLE